MDLRNINSVVNKAVQEAADKLGVVSDMVYDAISQSCQEIEKQLDVETFQKNIMALPEKIRVQQEACKEARSAFEVAKGNLVNAESMVMAVITAETNDNGKAKYTNEAARKAELEIRKKTDWEYEEAWEPYKRALDELDNANFLLEQLQNEFKAYQVVGGLLATRLSLMHLDL